MGCAGDRILELILGPQTAGPPRAFSSLLSWVYLTISKRIRSNTLSPPIINCLIIGFDILSLRTSCPRFWVGHPPFDRLRVRVVMVSLSNHGFPPSREWRREHTDYYETLDVSRFFLWTTGTKPKASFHLPAICDQSVTPRVLKK